MTLTAFARVLLAAIARAEREREAERVRQERRRHGGRRAWVHRWQDPES